MRSALIFLPAAATPIAAVPDAAHPGMTEVLAASKPADWQPLDPQNTLVATLRAGRVVIELAPAFAPLHVRNIETLARARYFDGLPVLRVQENYVAQWGDPDNRHPIPTAVHEIPPEFDAPQLDRPFTRLPDGDVYAPEVGFSDGFPAARSAQPRVTWLAHCYGMVGVGRDLDVRSGSGAEMYVVIGHSPRHLDRNVTLVGRVVQGMELLTSLPRGSEAMGFYAKDQSPVLLRSIRVAADLPQAERPNLEVLRTDTPTFAALVESRRNRPEEFFRFKAARIDLCNVPLPVRERH